MPRRNRALPNHGGSDKWIENLGRQIHAEQKSNQKNTHRKGDRK